MGQGQATPSPCPIGPTKGVTWRTDTPSSVPWGRWGPWMGLCSAPPFSAWHNAWHSANGPATKRLRARSLGPCANTTFPALSGPNRGLWLFFLIRRGRGRWRFSSCVCVRVYELDRGLANRFFLPFFPKAHLTSRLGSMIWASSYLV
jgi:hypothetical protein